MVLKEDIERLIEKVDSKRTIKLFMAFGINSFIYRTKEDIREDPVKFLDEFELEFDQKTLMKVSNLLHSMSDIDLTNVVDSTSTNIIFSFVSSILQNPSETNRWFLTISTKMWEFGRDYYIANCDDENDEFVEYFEQVIKMTTTGNVAKFFFCKTVDVLDAGKGILDLVLGDDPFE